MMIKNKIYINNNKNMKKAATNKSGFLFSL